MVSQKIGSTVLFLPDNMEGFMAGEPDKENLENKEDLKHKENLENKEIRVLEEIVYNYSEDDYHSQITSRKSWTAMYQLAESRAGLIEWLDIPKQSKVLELGAGCGSITSALLKKGAAVTCQEENLYFSRLNARRHAQKELTIYAVPFDECEAQLADDFDLAVLIGVPFPADRAERLLRTIRAHLKPKGMLVLAAENKFGLKYWAGNKEPHTNRYFAGLENAGIQLYSKRALEDLLGRTGFTKQEFYYPYPDYRFALELYSDRHLPKKGDLNYNIANYEDDRLLLFDEQKVYDSIIEEGQFPFFSNSYLCLAADDGGEGIKQETEYVRYASDRSRELAVRTDLNGRRVCKRPMYPQGARHIAHIAEAYERLCRQYEQTDLKFNHCVLHTQEEGELYAEFEYLHAKALQTQVEQAAAAGNLKKVFDILHKIRQYIRNSSQTVPFTITKEFTHVFGNIAGISAVQNAACSEVSDIDLILPNILTTDDGTWHVIDYEWTFFFPIPQDFVIYRTLFFLNHENPDNDGLTMDRLLAAAGISQEEAAVYAQMEEGFQQYVTGGLIPYREMVNLLERRFFNITELKADYDRVVAQNNLLKGRGIFKIARAVKKKLTGN